MIIPYYGDIYCRAARMLEHIVDALLKYHEDIFTRAHFNFGIEYFLRDIDLEADIACLQQRDSKLAHAYREVINMVVLRVYRPNNIIHSIQHGPRLRRNMS